LSDFQIIVIVIAATMFYGAVIIAVNCHCESSPGSFGQSSMSAKRLPTFGPDQLA